MCRMIAATGELDLRALGQALRQMAANNNPAHTHERRPLGELFRHEDGWGAAWVENDTLHVRHSIRSCLTDPLVDELGELDTDLIVLHARRASHPRTVCLENTHPFLLEHNGRAWAFCHNGIIHDLSPLRPATGLIPSGTIDSELLFHHVLNYLDSADLEQSLIASLDPVQDYTALHCMLVGPDQILATAKRHPLNGLPEYHALWEGTGPSIHVVSSEPVEGIGCRSWRRLPEPGVVTLHREAFRFAGRA